MAFNDVVRGFEGSRCNLDQYVAFKEQLFREHQKDPTYKFDREKLLRRWSLGYDVTKNIWDTVKRLPKEIRSASVTRNRLHVVFASPQGRYTRFILPHKLKEPTLDDVAEAIVEDGEDDDWVYKRSPIMRRNSFQLYDDLISRMLGSETSFDKAIMASCKTRAGLFIGDFGQVVKGDSQPDSQESSVKLEVVDSYLNLGLRRVSTNPLEQQTRVIADLNEVRKDPAFTDENLPIIAFSWLIKKGNSRFFDILGIDLRSIIVRYYRMDTVFRPKSVTTPDRPLFASLEAITLSNANLRRFLLNGVLPDVGSVVMFPEQFFDF